MSSNISEKRIPEPVKSFWYDIIFINIGKYRIILSESIDTVASKYGTYFKLFDKFFFLVIFPLNTY